MPQTSTRVISENVVEQFADVFFVDVVLLFFVRHDQIDSRAENLLIERRGAEIGAGACESFDLNYKFVGKRVELISGRERDVRVYVDAVDDDRWISVVVCLDAISVDDEAVVFKG